MIGIHTSLYISLSIIVVAAILSLARGKEIRKSHSRPETDAKDA
jgi:hypothetical protein